MIRVTCSTCGAKFDTADANAGKRGKCNNCGTPITVPAAQASGGLSPPAPSTPQPSLNPQAPTVVVQMQQPMVSDLIGPASKSKLLVWLLAGLTLQYFYLGQTGKGLLFLLLDLFVWGPIIFFTCGIGLLIYVPYKIFLLIDSLVLAGKIRHQPIRRWQFF